MKCVQSLLCSVRRIAFSLPHASGSIFNWQLPVGWCMSVEHSNIKECPFKSSPQKPLAAMSSLAPFEMLADHPHNSSLVTSCKSGSIRTSLHTSVSRFVVRSLILLWRMEGKPPHGQYSTCSIVSSLHTCSLRLMASWSYGIVLGSH